MGLFLRLFIYGSMLSATGILLHKFIEFSDVYKVVHSHLPGQCKLVPGVEHGSEDLAVLPSGLAIVSTVREGDGLQVSKAYTNKVKGALMSFNFAAPQEPIKELKLSGFKGQLHPHGLGIFSQAGKVYVYVVNHPPFNEHPPDDVVEKFLWEVETGTLVHQKTFTDPEFIGLNNLVVVGMDKFYVTNYQISKSNFLREMESLFFAVPLQNVVYFDEKNGTVVLRWRYGANGINISPDNKYLYLAEVYKKRVTSFKIESPLKLTEIESVNLGSIPDNINVDPETGDLWIGCHPVGYKIAMMLFNPANKAPSQVLRVGVSSGKFLKSTEIYSDDGSTLSGCSAAVYFKGALLIGTVDHKLMFCKCSNC